MKNLPHKGRVWLNDEQSLVMTKIFATISLSRAGVMCPMLRASFVVYRGGELLPATEDHQGKIPYLCDPWMGAPARGSGAWNPIVC